MSEPHDPSFGVKVFSIGGRLRLERERLKGMTDEERRWRAQFLKDQVLSPEEPRNVPEYYKETNNIIRRLYKDPLYSFQKMLEPALGYQNAYYARHTVGKTLIVLYASWVSYYVFKYYSNDWTRAKTLEVYTTRPKMYPNDPGYPNYPKIEKYYDQNFSSSPFFNK